MMTSFTTYEIDFTVQLADGTKVTGKELQFAERIDIALSKARLSIRGRYDVKSVWFTNYRSMLKTCQPVDETLSDR